MVVTLGDLKNDIINITARDMAAYGNFAQQGILTAIKYMETEHPYNLQKGGTVTVLANTNSIPLPGDLNQLIYVQYDIGGVIYNAPTGFQQESYPVLLSLYTTTNQVGIPSKYAIFNESLYIYPLCADDIEYTLSYYYTDSFYPQTDSDTSVWFGDTTIDCVRAKAIEWFYRYPLEAPDLADRYQQSFEDYLRNLQMKNNTKKYFNRLSI